MRPELAVALAFLIPACSSSSACPGLIINGQCLVSSGHAGSSAAGGASGAGGTGGTGTAVGAEVGAACDQPRELVCGHAIDGTDTDRILLCDGGSFTDFLPCVAPSTCATLSGNTSVHCGPVDDLVPYAIENDPCTPDAAAACPAKRDGLLVCKGATWQRASDCKGDTLCHRSAAGTQGPGWTCPAASTNGCVVCE